VVDCLITEYKYVDVLLFLIAVSANTGKTVVVTF